MEKPLPKSLRDLFARHPDKFADGWTEKDYSAGDRQPWSHWIYLKRGYCYPEPGAHIIHEQTVAAVREAFRDVKPCDCDDCKAGAASDNRKTQFADLAGRFFD